MDASKEIKKRDREITRLKGELTKRDEKIQHYKKEQIKTSVIKRWKIGKYLHDNLAQKLLTAKFSLSSLRSQLSKENLEATCDEVLDILEESIHAVRDLSHDVIPLDVEKEGVGQAFIYLKNRTEKLHSVNCKLETGKYLSKINSRTVATNLYNIAQEAIKNAVIHGEAEHIKIALIDHEQQLYLHIKDDGRGYDPESQQNGMGLRIMKYRAEEMGGDCRIKDAKDIDYTTCVTCSVPIEALTKD